MAKTVTLAQLRTQVRFQGGFDNVRKVPDARLDEAINGALARVWALLLQYRPDAYQIEGSTSNTAGSGVVALPADFMKLVLVEVLEDGRYIPLEPYHVRDQAMLEQSTSGRLWYRFTRAAAPNPGPALRVVPVPATARTFRVHYLPCFTDLALDADTFDGVNGYEDVGISDAIASIRARDGIPAQEFAGAMPGLEARLRTEVSDMDAGRPFMLSGPAAADDDDWIMG